MADKRLYMPSAQSNYSALDTLMSGTININHIRTNWDEVLRLATPIQQGIVTASLIVRKISSYPCQNGLAVALREIGRMERTLFYVGLVDESGTTPKSNSRIKQG